MELIAFVPAIMFCSEMQFQCMTVHIERVKPKIELCESAIDNVKNEAIRLQKLGQLPADLYIFRNECIAVFD